MLYEVQDHESGEVLSQHRTRQGAVDAWRERHPGRTVRIFRSTAGGVRTLIVEGIWHDAKRGDVQHLASVTGLENVGSGLAEIVEELKPLRDLAPPATSAPPLRPQ